MVPTQPRQLRPVGTEARRGDEVVPADEGTHSTVAVPALGLGRDRGDVVDDLGAVRLPHREQPLPVRGECEVGEPDAPAPGDKLLPADKVRQFPTTPGVYLMKDAQGRVIYVGKAKNLRNRAAHYFVKAAAEESKQRRISDDEPGRVDVTVCRLEASSEEAVAREAKKGYDLLLVGVANAATNGAFDPSVTLIAAAFDGPLAITVGKGIHLRQPERSPLHILVPVNGTDVSRRAAEVAIAIAHACNCPVAALYVAPGVTDNPRKRRGFRARQQEQAIMKDFVEMADRYDVRAKTAVRADLAPDKAILAELKEAKHDLIIMGAGRRPGDKLFFGDTAAAVLEKSPASILFVAT